LWGVTGAARFPAFSLALAAMRERRRLAKAATQ